ncbi:MAG: wax ester/triacylglycerol synthase family O-acyltransferase [Oceanococcaceae bacterium]
MRKKLPIVDAAWLMLENRERPMHVGGLQLFDLPRDAPPDTLHTIAEQFREGTMVKRPFNQRLETPYSRSGSFHWIEDNDFDLEYHFRHSALPKPGRVRELLSLVSRLHSSLLDRHRPLWETHLIEGLEGNRFAVYTKIHHSVVDGVAGMKLAMNSFSENPDERNLPPPWAEHRDNLTLNRQLRGGAVLAPGTGILGRQAATLPAVYKAFRDQYRKARFAEHEVVPYQAPPSMLNKAITGSRRVAAQSYSLPRIRKIAEALDGTVNDVVMAMSAAALRAYLCSNHALPSEPLTANVPVSIRPADDESGGNAIGFMLCSLATNIGDPSRRFQVIQDSMRAGKERLKQMSREEITNYSLLLTSPMVLGQLMGFKGERRPPYNVVISNVPGPRQPLYWNGMKMSGMYPVSLLLDGQALNITVVGYVDSLEFGITACRKTLPSMQRLLDYLEDALAELEMVAGIGGRKRRAKS